MRRKIFWFSIFCCSLAFLVLGGFGCNGTDDEDVRSRYEKTTGRERMGAEFEQDIVDTAIAARDFNTLVAAVKAADLVDTLKSEGPFTVFAPTDEAFGNLPAGALDDLLKPANKEKLRSILTYHVVAGEYEAEDVVKKHSLKTVNGAELSIRTVGSAVMVDGANVIKTDIGCTNGVIHVIDNVVMP